MNRPLGVVLVRSGRRRIAAVPVSSEARCTALRALPSASWGRWDPALGRGLVYFPTLRDAWEAASGEKIPPPAETPAGYLRNAEQVLISVLHRGAQGDYDGERGDLVHDVAGIRDLVQAARELLEA